MKGVSATTTVTEAVVRAAAFAPAGSAGGIAHDARADRLDHLVFAGDPRVAPARRAGRAARPPHSPAPSEPAPDPEAARWFARLCELSGLDPSRYRPAVVRRRLAASLRAVRAASIDHALAIVERDARAREAALGAFLIGVTSFLRDRGPFEELARRLDELDRDRADPSGLAALSLACADGQELYSLAMLLAERGLLREPSRLVGVDCRPQAVLQARAGLYPEAALAALSPERRARWFEPAPGGARVVACLRRAARFEVGDAFARRGGPTLDLCLCRNLAIYIASDAAGELWSRIAERLRPGGLLVVGRAERPPAAEFAPLGACVFRRRPGR